VSFSCPHFDIDRDACLRLKTDCVPGRPGCVLAGSLFAVPIIDRLREREEENRRRAAAALFAQDDESAPLS
jgi:hypothetical protein